jgi:hypothetical protein
MSFQDAAEQAIPVWRRMQAAIGPFAGLLSESESPASRLAGRLAPPGDMVNGW